MLFPASEADPAKLVAATCASHVITALVLLDGLFALRAGLRVGHDPLQIRALCVVLFFPCQCHLTVSRLMGLKATLKAE